MMAHSRHQEKTFTTENKTLESRKIFQSLKKMNLRKKFLKLWKIFPIRQRKIQNREKYFKLEKNVSESRNILLQESRKKIEFNDFEFNKHNIKSNVVNTLVLLINLGSMGCFKPYLRTPSSSSVNLILDKLSTVSVGVKGNTEFFCQVLKVLFMRFNFYFYHFLNVLIY